jgi:thiosulfate/3-mercaptopyruvate sulfurtransferase
VNLVSTAWLEEHLADPSVVIFEVSIDPPESAAYFTGHVPGALFVYWKDLVWHDTDRQCATPDVLAERLGERGVGDDTTVALIGDPFQFAPYTYWVMTMGGQEERCRLVDGGRRAWLAHGRPLTTEIPEVEPRRLAPGVADQRSRVGRDEVLAGLGVPGRVLIDLRSPEEYRGERVSPPWVEFDHGAERRGHIPGAHNLFVDELLQDDGTLLPPDRLRERFDELPLDTADEIVTYCRLSHRGSLGWFVLTRILGRDNVRVYDGSWTEWGSMVGMPVEV